MVLSPQQHVADYGSGLKVTTVDARCLHHGHRAVLQTQALPSPWTAVCSKFPNTPLFLPLLIHHTVQVLIPALEIWFHQRAESKAIFPGKDSYYPWSQADIYQSEYQFINLQQGDLPYPKGK